VCKKGTICIQVIYIVISVFIFVFDICPPTLKIEIKCRYFFERNACIARGMVAVTVFVIIPLLMNFAYLLKFVNFYKVL